MYYTRTIRKTKRDPAKASLIIGLPMELVQKMKTRNPEISKRLATFTRIRYIDLDRYKCIILVVSSHELPSDARQAKYCTTTIQKSGRTSRYVLLPKRACQRLGWKAGTELVIGFGYHMPDMMYYLVYDGANLIRDGANPETLVMILQRYQDTKMLYREELEKERARLDDERDKALWEVHRDWEEFGMIAESFKRRKKELRAQVWDQMHQSCMVPVSYHDYIRLRADSEREKKRKRRLARQRQGPWSSWEYRKSMIPGHGIDWDARREAALDDPGLYDDVKSDDPEMHSNEEQSDYNYYQVL